MRQLGKFPEAARTNNGRLGLAVRTLTSKALAMAGDGEALAAAMAGGGSRGRRRPHILAFPFPIPGHMNPLMHLCHRLASSFGFRITFACNEDSYQLMLRTRDLVAEEASSKLEIHIVALPDGIPRAGAGSKLKQPNPSENLETPAVSAIGMRPALEQFIQQKLQEEDGNPVACILSDTFMGWVQDVANKFEIPRAVFWTSNAVNDIIHIYLPQLVAKGFVPVSTRKTDELITFLPGIPPMPPTDLPLSFYYDHPVIEVISDGGRRFAEAQYALCNSFEELEQETVSVIRRELKGNYLPVGPCLSPAFFFAEGAAATLSSALSEEDIRCLKWLDAQPDDSSVIYVSFGSVATMSAQQAEQLALGLESSGQRFLLVLRKTLVSDPALQRFLDEFLQRTRDLGLVVSWAPQMHVLLHRAVGGFLTHCGWNSTIEGICAGVPMLAWPCMAEQNVNCRELVGRWRIALEVVRDDDDDEEIVSAKAVARFVQRLMAGEEGREMRKRGGELQEASRNALSEGGSSYNNLKIFAEGIRDRISA